MPQCNVSPLQIVQKLSQNCSSLAPWPSSDCARDSSVCTSLPLHCTEWTFNSPLCHSRTTLPNVISDLLEKMEGQDQLLQICDWWKQPIIECQTLNFEPSVFCHSTPSFYESEKMCNSLRQQLLQIEMFQCDTGWSPMLQALWRRTNMTHQFSQSYTIGHTGW